MEVSSWACCKGNGCGWRVWGNPFLDGLIFLGLRAACLKRWSSVSRVFSSRIHVKQPRLLGLPLPCGCRAAPWRSLEHRVGEGERRAVGCRDGGVGEAD